MKGKMSSGIDTNMIIAGIVIAIIVLGLIFVFMGRKNQENFSNKNINEKKKKSKNEAWVFKSARAGVPNITCSSPETDEKKNLSIDKSKELCPQKDGKNGHWVCNDVVKTNPKTKKIVQYTGCGCMYPTDMNDPNNLFNTNES